MAKVDEILQKLCDYVYNAGASAKHNGIFVGGEPKKEASQAIKAIISDQVAKARIGELQHIREFWGQAKDDTLSSKPFNFVALSDIDDRIAQLRSTPNEDMDN